MALRSNLVNLDAMIKRADFASAEEKEYFEMVPTISLRDLTNDGLIGSNLRKPDFQRETSHWTPDQVFSLLECFTNGDLIPSVILWKSPTYLFVIDGGHRLSALKAWIDDDYGDGPLSAAYFGQEITREQIKIAEKTRNIINKNIGSWQHFKTNLARLGNNELTPEEVKKVSTITSRGLPIQWVNGDADKAEKSFFKINTKGTPLDEIEELLLKNRKKPIPIAARAIIRSGKGHKYWSSFTEEKTHQIELNAKILNKTLFEPEINRPIKTLDLPLGGSRGVRTAMQVLIDFLLIADMTQHDLKKCVIDMEDDKDGDDTIRVLKKGIKLANRITGNDGGSLGLHPAVYFYGPTGRHSSPMFMGTVMFIGSKLINNDYNFFKKFNNVRESLENVLIENKELIATILQKSMSEKRTETYAKILNEITNKLSNSEYPDEQFIIESSGIHGKLIIGSYIKQSQKFNDDEKSKTFIHTALSSAIKCPICKGYLDPDKSVSYDHIERVREGGNGSSNNCQLTHPYCNQSIKQ